MKHLLAAGATVALLMAGTAYAHDSKHADRDVISDFDFTNFDSISVEGVYLLDIRAGDTFSIRTEATDEDAKWQDVTLKGSTLHLGMKKSKSKRWNKNDNSSGVRAIITMPRLIDLDVAGVATGTISAFTGGNVDVDIAGVSELTLSGTCDRLDIDMAGVGEVDGQALKCDDVDADLGGVGSLSVYASTSIDASAGGLGSIEVYGDPEMRDIDDGFMSKVKIR
jgi:hypothetical protein